MVRKYYGYDQILVRGKLGFMKKIILLSDIHANYPALSAVVTDAKKNYGAENIEFWFLGDVVGYGPHPFECLKFMLDSVADDRWVLGNHDAMLLELLRAELDPTERHNQKITTRSGLELLRNPCYLKKSEWEDTNDVPVKAILKNILELGQHDTLLSKLDNLSTNARAQEKIIELNKISIVLVHGSLNESLARYVYPWDVERFLPEGFKLLAELGLRSKTRVQFFGHTHVPSFIESDTDDPEISIRSTMVIKNTKYPIADNKLYLINPGSVGQPRDFDPRASYAMFDQKEKFVEFRRVSYPHYETAEDLLSLGYSDSLADRLFSANTSTRYMPKEWEVHFKMQASLE